MTQTLRTPRSRGGFLTALVVVLATLFVAAGCSDDGGDSASTKDLPATTEAAETRDVTIYWATEDGALVSETRATKADDALVGALSNLQSGAPAEGALPAFFDGASIISTETAGSVALIDVNQAFAELIPPGGAQAQTEVLAPLVYTATAVEGIDSVSITVEGKSPNIPGLAFDLSEPITRDDLPIEVAESTP